MLSRPAIVVTAESAAFFDTTQLQPAVTHFTLHCNAAHSQAFKTKTTDGHRLRTSPVYGFIEPGQNVRVRLSWTPDDSCAAPHPAHGHHVNIYSTAALGYPSDTPQTAAEIYRSIHNSDGTEEKACAWIPVQFAVDGSSTSDMLLTQGRQSSNDMRTAMEPSSGQLDAAMVTAMEPSSGQLDAAMVTAMEPSSGQLDAAMVTAMEPSCGEATIVTATEARSVDATTAEDAVAERSTTSLLSTAALRDADSVPTTCNTEASLPPMNLSSSAPVATAQSSSVAPPVAEVSSLAAAEPERKALLATAQQTDGLRTARQPLKTTAWVRAHERHPLPTPILPTSRSEHVHTTQLLRYRAAMYNAQRKQARFMRRERHSSDRSRSVGRRAAAVIGDIIVSTVAPARAIRTERRRLEQQTRLRRIMGGH